MISRLAYISLVLITTVSAFAQDSVNMTLVDHDADKRIGFYMPQRVDFSPIKPDLITKLPDGLKDPLFAVLPFRLANGTRKVAVLFDAGYGHPAHFYIDTNGNGDLTDDPAVQIKSQFPNEDEYTARLPIGDAANPHPATVNFYHFHDDPGAARFFNTLFYYRDYAMMGTVTLNGKKFLADLDDTRCTGDFSGGIIPSTGRVPGNGIELVLDTNGSGTLNPLPGKEFNASKPFNIAGITYELRGITASGDFTIARSAISVAEIPPPPNLNPGQPIIPFTATTMDGSPVNFPSDYRGKIVLLDFWATWCGPCMGEVPGLAAVYQKYHAQGFDVLGVTLDNPNTAGKVLSVMKQNNMAWPEIYDGKGWEARLAQLYVVQSIPHPILVDGDTGKILTSSGHDLRGDQLASTIAKFLIARGN